MQSLQKCLMRLRKISPRSKGRLVDAPGRVRELGKSGVLIPQSTIRCGDESDTNFSLGFGLDARVTFTHGDVMSVDVPGAPFDLAIAQGSLMHLGDLPAALTHKASVL